MSWLLRTKIYYGWYVAGVMLLGTALSASSAQVAMGVMLKPITEDLGWSRTAASGAITVATFASGALSPFVGRLADKHGPRMISVLAALVVVCCLVGLAFMQELWQFYLVYFVGRGVSAVTLTGVVPATVITNWFRRMRGRVLGFMATAFSAGAAIAVFTGQLIIDSYGWRTAFLVFAAVLAVGFMPLAWLILRRRPEDLGLRPDGDPPETVGAPGSDSSGPAAKASRSEFNWSAREAARTPALWLLTFGIFLGVLGTSGVAFHQVAYYTDMGVATAVAALAVSLYAISGAISSIAWGFLSERFSERHLALGAMLLGSAVIASLVFVRSPEAAMLSGALLGVASRGELTIVNLILGQYFGRSSYGTINGIVLPFQQLGLGLGPIVASVIFDQTGAYHAGFYLFAGCYLVAGLCFWLARKPGLPPRARAETFGLDQPVDAPGRL